MILASLFVREFVRARRTASTPEEIKRLEKIQDGMEFLKQTALIGAERPVYGGAIFYFHFFILFY